MPRKLIDPNTTEFLHITARVHRRNQFPLSMSRTWTLVSDHLRFTQFSFGLDIVNFVLMPNHYHMLCRAPLGNIGQAMCYFNGEISQLINLEAKRINQLWGGRYHRCQIESFHYFRNVYKYIYQNPLRANLVSRVEDYPYSTLRSLLGLDWASLIVSDDLVHDSGSIDDYLDWMNRVPENAKINDMRKALKKSRFKLPKYKEKQNPLEFEVY